MEPIRVPSDDCLIHRLQPTTVYPKNKIYELHDASMVVSHFKHNFLLVLCNHLKF